MADSTLARLSTGIGGLDEILGGGLIRGDAYLVRGWPGSGKTTFGNQLAYNHARDGGRTVFATLLAEPHDRMLAHLRSFSFYDPEQVAERLRYLSIHEPIARDGLQAGLELLHREVRQERVTLLVIDGAGLLEGLAPNQVELRRFAHTLQAQLGMLGCTPMLLVNPVDEGAHPLEPHVDGILRLENRSLGGRDLRFLRVAKLRGSAHAGGCTPSPSRQTGSRSTRASRRRRCHRRPPPAHGRGWPSGWPDWTTCCGAGCRPARPRWCWDRRARGRR